MKFLRYGVLASMIVAVASLAAQAGDKDKDKDKDKVVESPFYPMAVGTVWNYKVGNMLFTMKVTKHELVDKTMCARVELVVDNKVQAFEHIGITADGVYRFMYEGRKTEPPVRILKLPPKAGESWEVNSKVGGETLKGEFKAAEEEISVPAGKFKTMTVSAENFDANGSRMNFKYYFARDVGMVKQELEVNGQKAIIELQKYEPAKK